ncbi:MAG: hypothetical protein GYB33_03740 [Gammaproteobacteria bacterium]|uniref:hypothetical protein n=1 Tax=Pseudomaricurvus alcaniphilus TaxID=1166482 RepID=UPI00140E8027|nr:hypothetical protein [Pseudomaricurvus alcaniphilus]MBR9909449.1 hypothetical protein [Gammaproteobacteria bacterium]NHN37146.1 hypothetical protein [Pseudomaricurvus alcaniphilus]
MAHALASRMGRGTLWINQHCAFGPHIPFPPAKERLEEFTAIQLFNISGPE